MSEDCSSLNNGDDTGGGPLFVFIKLFAARPNNGGRTALIGGLDTDITDQRNDNESANAVSILPLRPR
jgi:hypothetical protein